MEKCGSEDKVREYALSPSLLQLRERGSSFLCVWRALEYMLVNHGGRMAIAS